MCVRDRSVSHAATLFMSDVCFSVRPDSDSNDLTAERLAVCFFFL